MSSRARLQSSPAAAAESGGGSASPRPTRACTSSRPTSRARAAEETAALAKERGANSLAVATDVTDPASVEALAEATYREFGAAHLLCNNAAVIVLGPIEQMTAQDLDWMLAVNLHGVVNGVQAFVPRMREQGGEKQIVNTASMSGLVAGRGGGALGGYVASKFAVVGLTESLQIELAPEGIAVALFCPGVTETRIRDAQRNRQQAFGPAREVSRRSAAPPTRAARRTRRAIRWMWAGWCSRVSARGAPTSSRTRRRGR